MTEPLNETPSTDPEAPANPNFKMRDYKSTKTLKNGTVVTYNYQRAVPVKPRKSRKKEYSKTILANLSKELSDAQLILVINFVRETLGMTSLEVVPEVSETENIDD